MTQLERMARVEEKVDGIDKKLDQLIEGLDQRYASKLVERIVYGLCGIVLISVVVALIALVVWRQPGTTNNLHVSTEPNTSPATAATTSVVIRSIPSATPAASPATASTPTPSPAKSQSILGLLPLN